MSPVSRSSAGGRAFLELQKRAKASGRNTQELLDLYTLEGFLARLAISDVRDRFVLKGGVLLAAFGNRRPTRDVDLAGQSISSEPASVLAMITTVVDVEPPDDDGITFRSESATSEVIRDEDEYSGVRISIDAQIATARIRFHIDVNLGDPIVPRPTMVSVPRLIGGEPIRLWGYPLHMVLAEKIVTAVQRGVANTRWRDFGDIWTLTQDHEVAGSDLQHAIREVARHRRAELVPLADVLDGYAALAQSRWVAWRRRNNRADLPLQFGDVITQVITFAEPPLTGDLDGGTWSPHDQEWR
ncbi:MULTISPECIES: nucleotidyl transferase AbiEii/AbiGii toxin family protein [unclassified Mycobacterium]|uniref:nucleotidyl transferase AbiEii/AbiGii toxin family protein n=1 Tax=unclassified Mycobacterium TaxID=2642494 RepID=UPI0029C60408|nr:MULTISPECIES: nucleotidyl transferase AbiEii/AbiGii toxin family protein [unclassified Mycobacterium]